MTAREQTILYLSELRDSIMVNGDLIIVGTLDQAIKALDGDDPFEDEDEAPFKCTGECDKTYEIQQEYESAIQDAIDELQEIQGKTKAMDDKLKGIIRDLQLTI
jgi:hypothetical protein